MVTLAVAAGFVTASFPAQASTPSYLVLASDETPTGVDASISADGKRVAYMAYEGAPSSFGNVFVKNLVTGDTVLVSKASDGTPANGGSRLPSISANGQYVAFSSNATNLMVGSDLNGPEEDVFIHDLEARTTRLVSVSSGPLRVQGNSSSLWPAISGNGAFVAFRSFADNLVLDDDGPALSRSRTDIFVHDLANGTTTEVSRAPDGTQANGTNSAPDISDDGRFVVYHSSASNLVVGDTNASPDVFVHDRTTSGTTRVSVAGDGTQGNGDSSSARISGDGSAVGFTSHASNLVPNDNNGDSDVFVRDLNGGTTTRASVGTGGIQADDFSFGPHLSGDGRYVAFTSYASNLSPCDTNRVAGDGYDVFVRDRVAGTTKRVSVAADGSQLDKNSVGNDIRADGASVAFDTRSPAVPTDDDDDYDVFVATGPPPPAPTPVVSVGDVAVHEGDKGTRDAVFTVSLSRKTSCAVTVGYVTEPSSAATPSDFGSKSGTLTFASGVTALTVKIPVVGDTVDEVKEAFMLLLSSPTRATIGDGTGVGTILDDDPATVVGRRVAIGDVSNHEGDAGARSAVFTVSLSKASTSYVTVNFATAKGTATSTDFTASSGTLSFAPGIISLNVKIAITPDTAVEANETFSVKLSSPSGASVADSVGVGTIIDDD